MTLGQGLNPFELFALWFFMAWLAIFTTALVVFSICMRIIAWVDRRQPFSKHGRR